jgi:hypothetical protein
LSAPPRAPPPAVRLTDRLQLILRWYQGMVSERTQMLVYAYDPEQDRLIEDGTEIRNIASIWDMELLGSFLGRSDLRPLIERSLRHYTRWLVPRGEGALVLDPAKLGEPTGLAHSAFLLLALLDSGQPGREAAIAGLAEGLLQQQRPDGSFRTWFGSDEDDGLEFYPGEAMLALMRAHAARPDERLLTSVERGFDHCRRKLPASRVAPDLLVFYANWQSQYAMLLHEQTRSDTVREHVRAHVFALHDRAIDDGFYAEIERYPGLQATVAVACAVEGINDGFALATRVGDAARARTYERCVRIALDWLGRAQRVDGAAREVGGFGHSLTEREQRIDVTGHVLSGLIKSAHNGIAT